MGIGSALGTIRACMFYICSISERRFDCGIDRKAKIPKIQMRIYFDKGIGSNTGKWLHIAFGPGKGYLRSWWVALNQGPGNATKPGISCGHKGLKHCNSAYCTRAWCNAQRWPVFGKMFLIGHTFSLWLGPTYFSRRNFKNTWHHLKSMRKVYPNDTCYKVVSFR